MYAYCLNNPVNSVDIHGMESCEDEQADSSFDIIVIDKLYGLILFYIVEIGLSASEYAIAIALIAAGVGCAPETLGASLALGAFGLLTLAGAGFSIMSNLLNMINATDDYIEAGEFTVSIGLFGDTFLEKLFNLATTGVLNEKDSEEELQKC